MSLVEDLEAPSAASALTASDEDLVLAVDHVAVAVEDLAAAVDWYTRVLGFSLLEERLTTGARTGMRSAVLKCGRAVVVLVQGTCPNSQVSRFIEKFGPGVQHVALEVADLDQAIRRLESAGGAVATRMVQDVGIRQVFLRRDAGSGVRIELIERRGGAFSDRTVEQLFRDFEAADLY